MGKTKTLPISYRGHLYRSNKALMSIDKKFGMAVHLARSNCCRNLQDLGVPANGIRIGLHWKGDIASTHFMNQLPITQIIVSVGYGPDEVYDPVHLLMPVRDRVINNIFAFVDAAMAQVLAKHQAQQPKEFNQTTAVVYLSSNDDVRGLLQKLPFYTNDCICWTELEVHNNALAISTGRQHESSCLRDSQLRQLCGILINDDRNLLAKLDLMENRLERFEMNYLEPIKDMLSSRKRDCEKDSYNLPFRQHQSAYQMAEFRYYFRRSSCATTTRYFPQGEHILLWNNQLPTLKLMETQFRHNWRSLAKSAKSRWFRLKEVLAFLEASYNFLRLENPSLKADIISIFFSKADGKPVSIANRVQQCEIQFTDRYGPLHAYFCRFRKGKDISTIFKGKGIAKKQIPK
ncbi:hypothetical protein ROZALSC1DRAFT_21689 [Rozella allomycis CSF55]|uniref:Uncharacterized protein n=1 Tax=Rozella allomycis (strain CSF55) TaxID=988480 RepID=A0A4P9YKX3_ROZAC|nr:hypothetical protein ROZALSC1DRAFT_21689 [Rozella allomycis CSF55]